MKKIILPLIVRERLAIRNVSESLEWRIRQRSRHGSRFSEAVRRRTALLIICIIAGLGVSAEGLSAAQIASDESKPKPLVPFLNNSYKNSRVFVGAKINPYNSVDCKKSSSAYDPYYCGLRNSPEVVRFSTPRAGITFTF